MSVLVMEMLSRSSGGLDFAIQQKLWHQKPSDDGLVILGWLLTVLGRFGSYRWTLQG